MNRVVLRAVDANSCIRLCMVVMTMVGAAVGVVSCFASFFGYDPEVRLIVWELHGFPGGIASIFVVPFLGAIFAMLIGTVSCVCLNLGLRFIHGIEVKGIWDEK